MVSKTIRSEPESPPRPVAPAALADADVLGMLNRADIVLTHGRSLADRVIQWGTRSYWNHAAMVFLLKDEAQGYLNTFVLESLSPHGVDVHPIDKYLVTVHPDLAVLRESRCPHGVDGHTIGKHLVKKHPDLAILRFPDSALPPERRVAFERRVRGFVLEEIDAKYGRRAILQIAEKILGPIGWLLTPVIRAMKVATGLNRRKAINDFICSGVIQYGYCRACFKANPATGELWHEFFKDGETRRKLIVSKETRDHFDPQMRFEALVEQLKLTRPADFSYAAIDHDLLECVAQRKNGVWGRQLTHR
jgi:hypothetical protein